MTNDEKNQPTKEPHPRDITRRDFATILVGAGIAAGVSSTAAAEVGMEMVETDVEIKTPDGTCDAAFIYPKSHPKSNPAYPGVLIWPDAFGLRPSLRTSAETSPPRAIPSWYPIPFIACPRLLLRMPRNSIPESRRYGEAQAADGVCDRARQRRKRCRRLRCLPRRAKRSEQSEKDRNPRLLHGRCACGPNRRSPPRSYWRGRVVPRRRLGDRQPTARIC